MKLENQNIRFANYIHETLYKQIQMLSSLEQHQRARVYETALSWANPFKAPHAASAGAKRKFHSLKAMQAPISLSLQCH